MVYYKHSKMEDKCARMVDSEFSYYYIIQKPLALGSHGVSAEKKEEQLLIFAAASCQTGLEGWK